MSTCRTARLKHWTPPGGLLLDRDRDLLRDHRRVVRDVALVTENQLQGVLAGRERQRGLGLPLAEVLDVVGRRQRGGHVGGRVSVDEEVMVPAVVELDPGGRDS